MPGLIFGTLAKTAIAWPMFLKSALTGAACLALMGVVGGVVLWAVGLRLRTYVPSLTWGNASFIGFPVALYGFGQVGLAYAIAFAVGSLIFNATIVQGFAAGAMNWKAVLRSPLLCAAVLGVLVQIARFKVPLVVINTCTLLGGMTVPLMLVMVGTSLARIEIKHVARAVLFSVFRIGMGAVVGLLAALALHLNGVARSILILQCSMPVAVLAYIFARRWNNEPEEVAGLVVASTWLSVISLPSLLGLLAA
jgi:hypothetical protein